MTVNDVGHETKIELNKLAQRVILSLTQWVKMDCLAQDQSEFGQVVRSGDAHNSGTEPLKILDVGP